MYNRLTKQAEASHEEMLREQTKLEGTGVDDKQATKVSDKQLEDVRDNKDLIDTTEVQLDAGREKVADQTIEALLSTKKGVYNKLRDDSMANTPVPPLALLNQAHEKEHLEAFNKARTANNDTAFWDKYVGDEMLSKKTKMVNKMGPCQLADNPDRFKGISTDPNELKPEKVTRMVMASLADADAMLFHIFYKAAGRPLTAEETSLVDGISRDKITVLSQLGEAAAPQQDGAHHRIAQLKELLDNWQGDHLSPEYERMRHELDDLLEKSRAAITPLRPQPMAPMVEPFPR